jgi:hypothetical protein
MHRRNFITKLNWILLASTIAGGAFLTYVRPGWESISMLGAAVLLALKTWLSRPREKLVDDESRRVLEEASGQLFAGNAPEAAALMRGDFERKKQANGASHPITLVAAQQLCTFLVAMGRREEARELMQQLEPTLREEHKGAPDVWAVVMQSAANLWLDAELTRDAQAMAALGLRYASRMKEPHRRRLELGLLGCHARANAQLGHAREALVETQALFEEAKTRLRVSEKACKWP